MRAGEGGSGLPVQINKWEAAAELDEVSREEFETVPTGATAKAKAMPPVFAPKVSSPMLSKMDVDAEE